MSQRKKNTFLLNPKPSCLSFGFADANLPGGRRRRCRQSVEPALTSLLTALRLGPAKPKILGSRKNVTIPYVVKARRAGTRRNVVLPDSTIRPARRRPRPCQTLLVPAQTVGRQSTDSEFYSRLKAKTFCLAQFTKILSSFLWITHPRRPVRPAPPLSMRTHVAPKRLCCIHTARRHCALRLSLPLANRFSPGRAGDAFQSVPVPARWPATYPQAQTGYSALP